MIGEHFDPRETRSADARAAGLASVLPSVVAAAARAPAQAARLAGIDPASVTDRAALARSPVLRKSDLPAMQKADPPFGGLVAAAPVGEAGAIGVLGDRRGAAAGDERLDLALEGQFGGRRRGPGRGGGGPGPERGPSIAPGSRMHRVPRRQGAVGLMEQKARKGGECHGQRLTCAGAERA